MQKTRTHVARLLHPWKLPRGYRGRASLAPSRRPPRQARSCVSPRLTGRCTRGVSGTAVLTAARSPRLASSCTRGGARKAGGADRRTWGPLPPVPREKQYPPKPRSQGRAVRRGLRASARAGHARWPLAAPATPVSVHPSAGEECKRGSERRALGAFAPRPPWGASNCKQATPAAASAPARVRGLAHSPLRWSCSGRWPSQDKGTRHVESSQATGKGKVRTPPLLWPLAAVVGTRHSRMWFAAPAPVRSGARFQRTCARHAGTGAPPQPYAGRPRRRPFTRAQRGRYAHTTGSGAVGPPRVALRQLAHRSRELAACALRHPDHSAPALRSPATCAVLLSRARLAANYSSNGPKDSLHSLAPSRAPVQAHTPGRPRHCVYGAALAGANVLLARAGALRRSVGGAGCGPGAKAARTPPPLHCAALVKCAARRCAAALRLRRRSALDKVKKSQWRGGCRRRKKQKRAHVHRRSP